MMNPSKTGSFLSVITSIFLLSSCILLRQKDNDRTLFPENQVLLENFVQTIKFRYDKWMYINSSLGNSGSNEYLLDTGSPCILRFEDKKELGLKSKKFARLGPMKLDYTSTNVTIGHLKFDKIGFMVMDFSNFQSMLGVNIMAPYIWQFDFNDTTIKITDSKENLELAGLLPIPFKPYNEQETPVVQLIINGADTIEAFIDTGYPGFCQLNKDVDISNFNASVATSHYDKYYDKKRKKNDSLIYSDYILLSNLAIGHIELKNEVVVRNGGYQGENLLGLRFLRKFESTIDWKEHVLYLKLGEENVETKNHFNYGFDWYRWKNQIMITYIYEGSSAEELGLQTGFIIETIKGVSVSKLDDFSIYNLLSVSSSNQEISIKCFRLKNEIVLKSAYLFK